MANIKIALDYTIIDGQPLSFKAPCDCTAVTGIKVEYPDGESTVSTVFSFADAHGTTLAGLGNLFAKGAMVRVLLDTGSNKAYIQNADTNAYLEAQLNGKAPAGYGLGGNGTQVTDWNTATANGFYADRVGSEAKHSPFIGMASWGYTIALAQEDAITQVAFTYATPNWKHALCQKMRHLKGASDEKWSEWEWVNPPMEVGAEYRTTERSGGKPVYVKRISATCEENISTVGDGTIIRFPHNISNFGNVVRCQAVMDTAYPLPHMSHQQNGKASIISVNYVDSTNIAVAAINISRTAPSFVFDIAYCKA